MSMQQHEEMAHNDHWKETWEKAHIHLDKLFAESGLKHRVSDIIGDDNGIDSLHDAKKVLVFVNLHRPTEEEKVCATLLVIEALMAWHELSEHG